MTKYNTTQEHGDHADHREHVHLEPRVAKLEVGLDRLTQDVGDLVTVVRSQGSTMEAEIQKLVVAVTQASGPRKTDWSVIISAVLLVMTIGSAVFWPLSQTTQETKQAIIAMEQDIHDHQIMDNHPVGTAIVKRLEERLAVHVTDNEKEMLSLKSMLEDKLEAAIAARKNDIQALADKQSMFNEKLFARLLTLEQINHDHADKDLEELRQWRVKAMTGKLKTVSPSTDGK